MMIYKPLPKKALTPAADKATAAARARAKGWLFSLKVCPPGPATSTTWTRRRYDAVRLVIDCEIDTYEPPKSPPTPRKPPMQATIAKARPRRPAGPIRPRLGPCWQRPTPAP